MGMRKHLAWALALTATLSPTTWAAERASIRKELYAGPKMKFRIGPAPSGKVMFLGDGRPRPLYWANLTLGDQEYRRAGLNTIFLEVGDPKREKNLDTMLAELDRLLLSIKRQNLYVVIYIHNLCHEGAPKSPWSFDDKWRTYVQAIVRHCKDLPNLAGWCFSDEFGDHLFSNPEFTAGRFRKYLQEEYKTIESLNEAWASGFKDFGEIDLEYSAGHRGRAAKSTLSSQHPYGIGPKAFDSAGFKLAHVAWANRQFEQAVREVDPDSPLLAGANNLGWPVTQIPSGWGAFFDFYPQASGHDFDTHHVWAMDIGRGPNVRPAMQMLITEHPADSNWHLDARVIRGWMVESAIHGASGITFWPWSFLGKDNRPGDRSSSVQRIDMCAKTIHLLESSGIFEMLPRPTIGVMYQPYAEGWGALSQVYGLLLRPSKEPVVLMRELKFGTRYGQVEYLTGNCLDQAELDRYGVILAPFIPDVDEALMARLTDYVRSGGVLLADVGFGCLQAGKVVTAMPAAARRLFGIGRLEVSPAEHGPFKATGAFAELLGGIKKGDSTLGLSELALDVHATTAEAALKGPGRQGLYVNKVGEGYAIFCSTLGWTSQVTKDPLLRTVHNALFARRARIEWAGEEDWSNVSADPYFSRGYEIAGFADGFVLQNHKDRQREMTVRVNGQRRTYTVAPRSVLLIRKDKIIPLGTGVWPARLGPKE